jgi:hypothetical protein
MSTFANGERRASDGADKVKMFGWKVVDEPGRFSMIFKQELHIDHDYQRTHVSNVRVNDIAREFSWVAFGVLLVAERPDGSKWVFDGQHRKLGADKRSDIQLLPCMVYQCSQRVNEAEGFLKSNTSRGPVKAIDKFNALVMAGEPLAVEVKHMVESSGYEINRTTGQFRVACVGALLNCVRIDKLCASRAWQMCVELFSGEMVHERVMVGLFNLEMHLQKTGNGSIFDRANRESIMRHGHAAILKSIVESCAYNGGGPKACAEGVLRLINKGRSSRRIPSVYGETVE